MRVVRTPFDEAMACQVHVCKFDRESIVCDYLTLYLSVRPLGVLCYTRFLIAPSLRPAGQLEHIP